MIERDAHIAAEPTPAVFVARIAHGIERCAVAPVTSKRYTRSDDEARYQPR